MAAKENASMNFELYDCLVCLSRMVDKNPRMLACHHSFCEDCLVRLVRKKSIDCPICREETILSDSEVTKLPMNFYIIKMYERESAMFQSGVTKCQLCLNDAPETKCEVCSSFLCASCRKEHDEMPGFEKHRQLSVCDTHGLAITHVCKQCVKPACMTCVIRLHREHKQECAEFFDGLKSIQWAILGKYSAVSEGISSLVQKLQQVNISGRAAKQIKRDITKWKEFLALQTERLQELSAIMTKDDKKRRAVIEMYTNLISKAKGLKDELITYSDLDGAALFEFAKVKERTEKILESIDTVSHIRYSTPLLNVQETMKEFQPPQLEKDSCEETNWTLSRELEHSEEDNPTLGLKGPEDIVSLGDKSVVIADRYLPYVLRIDMDGKVEHKYYPAEKGSSIVGVAVYNCQLYILQESAITKYSTPDDKGVFTSLYKPTIKGMSKLLVENSTSFIISDTSAGKVYKYNPVTNTTSLLVEDLNSPTNISMKITGQGARFAVTEYVPDKVFVFDEEWEMVSYSGGTGRADQHLRSPRGTLFSPGGTLLVADTANSRISEFDPATGDFKKHPLTAVYCPIALAYSHPYFWVLEYNLGRHRKVKRYLVQQAGTAH